MEGTLKPKSAKVAQVLEILDTLPPLTPAKARKMVQAIKSFSGRVIDIPEAKIGSKKAKTKPANKK